MPKSSICHMQRVCFRQHITYQCGTLHCSCHKAMFAHLTPKGVRSHTSAGLWRCFVAAKHLQRAATAPSPLCLQLCKCDMLVLCKACGSSQCSQRDKYPPGSASDTAPDSSVGMLQAVIQQVRHDHALLKERVGRLGGPKATARLEAGLAAARAAVSSTVTPSSSTQNSPHSSPARPHSSPGTPPRAVSSPEAVPSSPEGRFLAHCTICNTFLYSDCTSLLMLVTI